MPRFDKTGPQGAGPLSGRGFGPCGQGKRMGRFGGNRMPRCGRGFARRAMTPELSKTEQKSFLEQELKEIDLEKKELEKELNELE
ncbi:DUF5320 domain-containing protein [Candidatus Micrarchaeota archaeon]|nr:DUF5320 domain-containing protein [Candidatus Micrarchaeota archaeon]MBU1930598.1 DUF5320 domain-containing protein [Candidatus Micrarchaeota archaeon]